MIWALGGPIRSSNLPRFTVPGETQGQLISSTAHAEARPELPGLIWRPHGDSNPGSHRERVVS